MICFLILLILYFNRLRQIQYLNNNSFNNGISFSQVYQKKSLSNYQNVMISENQKMTINASQKIDQKNDLYDYDYQDMVVIKNQKTYQRL